LKSKLFFRADGSDKIGLGHIVRCLSIIQMVNNYFECVMIVNNADKKVLNIIKEICLFVDLEADHPMNEIEKISLFVQNSDILIIDGYGFDLQYQIELKKVTKKLVAIDDLSGKEFVADVIINHGDILVLPSYHALKHTKIYSGFDYLILRPDFIKAALLKKNVTSINTVFVCMGGADPCNITTKVIEACSQCDFIQKLIIVVGSFYKYKSDLKKLLSKINNVSIELIENATTAELVNCISRSQIAISTSSTISLEICCVKSALISGTVVDNQNAIHSLLINNGCCVSVGDWKKKSILDIKAAICKLNDTLTVQKIIDAQSKCVDGESPKKILNIFKNLAA
jgi:UDP-2,4-diacetamido-2,4,6-trideoxy-beta-L-altropyranose hydrolase